MKKIISLFQRNYDGDHQVRDEIVPGAEWVVAGEGVATEKIDGTACLVQDGKLYRRYGAKLGKTTPQGFIPAQGPDETTGHWPGWVLVTSDPGDKWHVEAWDAVDYVLPDDTYELVGPKVQGNPYGLDRHELWRHGTRVIINEPRDFEGLRDFLTHDHIEGIVWHRANGDMVKIKARDYGIKWS